MRDHKQVEVIEDCQEAIWEIRSELASLTYLLKGAQREDRNAEELLGLGLILERSWKSLDLVQEALGTVVIQDLDRKEKS